MDSLKERSALVIGGSSGIGRILAEKLRILAGRVAVHGSGWQKFTPQVLSEGIKSDLMEEILRADILCLAFGPFLQKRLHEMSAEEWQSMAVLNYALPGHIISLSLKEMAARRFGRILVFGGTRTEAVRGFRTNTAYAGAKTALCSLVKSVAMEYAQFGITCNAVLPGLVETELLSEEQKASLRQKMPLGRLVSAEGVAQAAVQLIQNPDANGVLLNLDGGWSP